MKKQLATGAVLPAMPLTLIATQGPGGINFAPHGQCATATHAPSTVSLSVMQGHKTWHNIKETGKFSVNIPPAGLLEKVKYCGQVSGGEAEKSGLFEVFYGGAGVPMVAECTVAFACKVVQEVEVNGYTIFIGEVLETYADETCIENGSINPEMARPVVCGPGGAFWRLGQAL